MYIDTIMKELTGTSHHDILYRVQPDLKHVHYLEVPLHLHFTTI